MSLGHRNMEMHNKAGNARVYQRNSHHFTVEPLMLSGPSGHQAHGLESWLCHVGLELSREETRRGMRGISLRMSSVI